jgi:hypothetical protein
LPVAPVPSATLAATVADRAEFSARCDGEGVAALKAAPVQAVHAGLLPRHPADRRAEAIGTAGDDAAGVLSHDGGET